MTPQRIQRKRTRGWRMPPNTVYVGRPSKWANPCVIEHERQRADAIAWYEAHIAPNIPPEDLRELRGKNLACYCPLDKPCHADVLLRLANAK